MSLNVMTELEQAGAILLNQHFVYKSGKHGSGYINMDPLFSNTELMWRLGVELWTPFVGSGFNAIASPATGGIALGYATAFSLHYEVGISSRGPIVPFVWADKDGDEFAFERAGFSQQICGKQVLVVEDLLTTGGSVVKVSRLVEQHGGTVVGVSAICNRGGVTAEDLQVPRLEVLANASFKAVEASNCPLCQEGVPIVEDIGHGKEYAQTHPDYKGGYVMLLT